MTKGAGSLKLYVRRQGIAWGYIYRLEINDEAFFAALARVFW